MILLCYLCYVTKSNKIFFYSCQPTSNFALLFFRKFSQEVSILEAVTTDNRRALSKFSVCLCHHYYALFVLPLQDQLT